MDSALQLRPSASTWQLFGNDTSHPRAGLCVLDVWTSEVREGVLDNYARVHLIQFCSSETEMSSKFLGINYDQEVNQLLKTVHGTCLILLGQFRFSTLCPKIYFCAQFSFYKEVCVP